MPPLPPGSNGPRRLGGLLCLAAALAACHPAAPPTTLTVAAASSLAGALDEIGQAFRGETGIAVTFVYGASGTLAEQLRDGAPYAALLSADPALIDQLASEGLLDRGSRAVFARGRLIVAVGAEGAPGVAGFQDLASPTVTHIALANPDHAPYGRAARQALERAGLWSQVQDRLIYAETDRQAAQFVATGNAQIALVAASEAAAGVRPLLDVPAALYDPPLYVAAVRLGSPLAGDARRFISFLATPGSASILSRHGLEPQGGS